MKRKERKLKKMLMEDDKMYCFICGKEITNLQLLLFQKGHCIIGGYHKKCMRNNSRIKIEKLKENEN